jgi:uroporphyrinogen decarboxylase
MVENYLDFSLDTMAKIVKGVKAKHPNIPITLFSKNGGKYLTYIADTLCDGIGIDWTVELGDVQNASAFPCLAKGCHSLNAAV